METPFESLGLNAPLVRAVEKLGYQQPTPIQVQAIPPLLEGRDVIGQAQTGTGKTAAYALPMLQKLRIGCRGIQALVLAPTRELAVQVAEAARNLAQHTPIRVLCVYGGQAYSIQVRQLERGVDLVVGTPGRLLDLIRQKWLDLSQVHTLVLDEADEMLEMGFLEDVETIMDHIPGDRQMALFSATLPEEVRTLAQRYLADPVKIAINPQQRTVSETEQYACRLREEEKTAALMRLLEVEEVKSALIFTRTKVRAQELADHLAGSGFEAEALHGDLVQARREMVLNRFRQRAVTLLVATDVAARGLDIDDVSHVFNFDLPQDGEDYVHRIGRTGRAGKKGMAVTFFTPRERSKLGLIEAYTRQKLRDLALPTVQDVQNLRDARFIERLTSRVSQSDMAHERALLSQLVDRGLDALDLAAAAVRLARSGENQQALIEIAKSSRREVEVNPPAGKRSARAGGTSRVRAGWQGQQQMPGAYGHRPLETGMVRLRMNLGETHGLRPRDVVGAIASEVGIPGQAIGSIEIREHYSFVDVAEKHVNRVLRESGGQYFLRGKPVMLTLAG